LLIAAVSDTGSRYTAVTYWWLIIEKG